MSEVALAPKGGTLAITEKEPARSPWPGRLADAGLVAAFLGLTFLLGVFPLKDTDFWWHLRTGDLIRQTGQVPTADTYTFGAEGHRWVDLHWIFQVLLSLGFERVGVAGLNLAKCAITALAVGLLITARRRDWPVWAMVLAWLPALLVLAGRMYIRPETLTLLYLACYLAILLRVEDRPGLAFLLPLIQVVWVNSHGLFVLGPVVLAVALVAFAMRRRALAPGRKRWWRTVLIATGLVGVACVVNPYGLAGALYPIELAKTMANPDFSRTIAELEPLDSFIRKAGLGNANLQLHLATVALGVLSFLAPIAWRVRHRATMPAPVAPAPVEAKRKRKKGTNPKGKPSTVVEEPTVGPSLFRLILFIAFTSLSLRATRNSHQFAAVVGTITAWNFGEWAAEVARRRARLGRAASATSGRVVALVAVFGLAVAVASGGFYAWEAEGRTVGLGEEPHWFPHAAVAFAGRPDMPKRSVCFHNGHAALYEYKLAPDRKTYADARLEVVGPDLYARYLALERKIAGNEPGWEADLDALGRPLILADNVHAPMARLTATLLASRRYRLVWFDEVAAVFVHEAYTGAVQAHAIDLAARHFDRSPPATDATAEVMKTKTCWNLAFSLMPSPGAVNRPGWRDLSRTLIRLGLGHAREARRLDPDSSDGWKWAGMLEALRELPGDEPIPRFRMPFDPVFDLSAVRASHDLRRALERSPKDGNALVTLAGLDVQRGMFGSAVALFDRFLDHPDTKMNLSDRERRMDVARLQRSKCLAELGDPPASLAWANLSDLDRLVTNLCAHGRAREAADVIESAYPAEGRPSEVIDRVATIRLHLGEAERAARLWSGTKNPPNEAIRQARLAAALFASGDLDAARDAYRAAIRADGKLFEARYGLAVLEADAGHAPESLAQARAAEKVVPHSAAGSAVDRLIESVAPYATP